MRYHHLVKASLLTAGMFFHILSNGQELYVFTEPASNMPAKSISAKISGKWLHNVVSDRFTSRYTPEVMFGVSGRIMVHVVTSFSDMYSPNLRWESAKLYGKYRFFSNDEVHKHFRLAAFGEIAHSQNKPYFEELSLDGDQSGVQAGLIATKLSGRFALSSTASYMHALPNKPKVAGFDLPDEAINYSLSAGLLVLPVNYTDFHQTNLNVYAELLGQRSLDMKKYNIDIAPAIQLIFNSNSKVNIGYRFQLNGNMRRMADQSWLVSYERTFLGALR